MTTKFEAGDKVLLYAPGLKNLHNRLGTVVAYDPRSNLFDVHLNDGQMPKKFYYSELLPVPVDTTPKEGYDKDMKEQKIANGTRVHINAPDAKGIHGKSGVVTEFNPTSTTYRVKMDDSSQPSFLYKHELVVDTEPVPKPGNTDALYTLRAEYVNKLTDAQKEAGAAQKAIADIDAVLDLLTADKD